MAGRRETEWMDSLSPLSPATSQTPSVSTLLNPQKKKRNVLSKTPSRDKHAEKVQVNDEKNDPKSSKQLQTPLTTSRSQKQRPTAENSGMKQGAILKFFIRKNKEKTPPPPAPENEQVEMDVEPQIAQEPVTFPQILYRTPKKEATSCTLVPVPKVPANPNKTPRPRQSEESTPPPESTSEPTATAPSPHRRQLDFERNFDVSETGRPPRQDPSILHRAMQQKRLMKTEAWQSSDVSLEEAGIFFRDEESDGNNNSDTNNRYMEERETPRRRASNASSCSSSSSTGIKRKRSEDNRDFPEVLVKVMKKKFRDDVKWVSSKSLDTDNVTFEKLEPSELAFIIQRYFLKIDSTNLPHPTAAEVEATLNFFVKGIRSSSSASSRFSDTLLDTFQIISREKEATDSSNPYWPVFVGLLTVGTDGKRRNKAKESLKLVQELVLFMQVLYEQYISQRVKLSLPFVVKLLQGDSLARVNVRKNLRELLNLLFKFADDSKEFTSLVALFNLAMKHYTYFAESVHFVLTADQIVQDVIWEEIAGRKDYGLPLIKKLKEWSIGERICSQILIEAIDEIRESVGTYATAQLIRIFKDIAESSLVLTHVEVDYDHGPRMNDLDNLKGETPFHRACAKRDPTMSIKKEKETNVKYFNRLLDQLHLQPPELAIGDINSRDNNGNSCLHDAAHHGRLDAITLLRERCWDPKREPSRTNLDILATDRDGNSPLHIALSSLQIQMTKGGDDIISEKFEVVKKLVEMSSQAPKKKKILFSMKNKKQESVFDFCFSGNPKAQEVKNYLERNKPVGRLPGPAAGGIKLDISTENKIKSSTHLQFIFSYWEYFHDKLSSQ